MKHKCEVVRCLKSSASRGLCQTHYARLMSGGDPHTPSYKELTPEERLRSKLKTPDPIAGCAEWSGYRNPRGYGQIRVGSKMILTHRFAYALHFGNIPEGMDVLHKCDNPPCCSVDHLFLGTHNDNMRDMVTKGRSLTGIKKSNAKLTDTSATEIINQLATGGKYLREIAEDFGVSKSVVSHIKHGRGWNHLK